MGIAISIYAKMTSYCLCLLFGCRIMNRDLTKPKMVVCYPLFSVVSNILCWVNACLSLSFVDSQYHIQARSSKHTKASAHTGGPKLHNATMWVLFTYTNCHRTIFTE